MLVTSLNFLVLTFTNSNLRRNQWPGIKCYCGRTSMQKVGPILNVIVAHYQMLPGSVTKGFWPGIKCYRLAYFACY